MLQLALLYLMIIKIVSRFSLLNSIARSFFCINISQTSALDSESEASVQDAIDGMLKRRHEAGDETNSMTVMVIAHR